jgi:hypothetical protein
MLAYASSYGVSAVGAYVVQPSMTAVSPSTARIWCSKRQLALESPWPIHFSMIVSRPYQVRSSRGHGCGD